MRKVERKDIVIALKAKLGKLGKKLKKAAGQIKGFCRNAGRKFAAFAKASAVAFAAVAVAVAGGIIKSIGAASRLEETLNKFNAVFASNSQTVKKWSDNFAKQVGRSKEQIASFMAGTQDLLVPMGLEPGAATKMSKDISRLAIDLASFNNKADGDVLRDLHAALTGSGEVMKKYGVIVSQTAVNQQLLADGINPKAATEAQKAQARLNIIMAGTTTAQGDAIRSAGSFANSKKRLAATFDDLSAKIGSVFLPIATKVVSWISEAFSAAETYMPAFEKIFSVVLDKLALYWGSFWAVFETAFEAGKNILESFGVDFSKTGDFIGNISDMISGFINTMAQIWIKAITFIEVLIVNWKDTLSIAWKSVVLGIVWLGETVKHWLGVVIPDFLKWFKKNWKDIFTDIWNGTKTIISNMTDNLIEFFKAVQSWLSGKGFNFKWKGLTEGFESALDELPKIAKRKKSDLEIMLGKQIKDHAKNITGAYQKKIDKRLKNLKKRQKQAQDQADKFKPKPPKPKKPADNQGTSKPVVKRPKVIKPKAKPKLKKPKTPALPKSLKSGSGFGVLGRAMNLALLAQKSANDPALSYQKETAKATKETVKAIYQLVTNAAKSKFPDGLAFFGKSK